MLKYILIFSQLLLISCSVVGLTNDYSKLTEEEKSLIHSNTDFKNMQSKNIYVINAQNLKNELQKNEKSIVYIFTNGCPSEFCLPMSVYENYAKDHNYVLYLVMSGYGNLNETMKQSFNSPLFAIDYEYYNTKYRSTAYRKFVNDLRDKPLEYKEKNYEGDLFFFEGDKLVNTLHELPESTVKDI